ncbi:MAG: hypothetical protein ABWX73_11745 [Marmoricola sp.]
MMADQLLARLKRLVGYVPTVWSLVRIACFAVLGLVLASLVIPDHPGDISTSPYNRIRGSHHSKVVSLPLGDTRGFRPTDHPDAFRIAWVGGSELLGVRPGNPALIPGLVNDKIGSVDGRRTRTDIYFLNAMRLADELAAVKRAVASHPDLLVISLNPVWVLNDLAVQQWGYLDGLLARGSLWPPSSWPVAASLVSPGDAGWKAMSSVFGPVDDRLYWGTDVSGRTADLSFLDRVPGGREPAPNGLGRLAQKSAVNFWQQHDGAPRDTMSGKELRQRLLRRGVISESSLNQRILREMFATARRSGVDTYFYLPAIAPEAYADPQGAQVVEKLRRQLTEATKGETDSRVAFDPQGLQDRVPPVPYKDFVHKIDPRPEAELLTGDLCAQLRRRGHETGCDVS